MSRNTSRRSSGEFALYVALLWLSSVISVVAAPARNPTGRLLGPPASLVPSTDGAFGWNGRGLWVQPSAVALNAWLDSIYYTT